MGGWTCTGGRLSANQPLVALGCLQRASACLASVATVAFSGPAISSCTPGSDKMAATSAGSNMGGGVEGP